MFNSDAVGKNLVSSRWDTIHWCLSQYYYFLRLHFTMVHKRKLHILQVFVVIWETTDLYDKSSRLVCLFVLFVFLENHFADFKGTRGIEFTCIEEYECCGGPAYPMPTRQTPLYSAHHGEYWKLNVLKANDGKLDEMRSSRQRDVKYSVKTQRKRMKGVHFLCVF